MKSICIYCGSSDNVHLDYLLAAYQTGAVLASRGIQLIYGGGKTGLMGKVADGCLDNGGKVIGVIVRSMNTNHLAHPYLTELIVTNTIHERKARMYLYSDGYIALPGGFGTMDELFETLTWAQIGEHDKPIGLLNVSNYFQSLLAFVEHAEKEGFIFSEHRQSLNFSTDPDSLIDMMEKHIHPVEAVKRWMRQDK